MLIFKTGSSFFNQINRCLNWNTIKLIEHTHECQTRFLQTLSLPCATSTDSAPFPRKQTAACKDLSAVPPKLLLQTYLWTLQKNVERGVMNECRFLFPVILLFSSRRHALLLNMENFWRLSLFLWLSFMHHCPGLASTVKHTATLPSFPHHSIFHHQASKIQLSFPSLVCALICTHMHHMYVWIKMHVCCYVHDSHHLSDILKGMPTLVRKRLPFLSQMILCQVN